jgi:hypothetical protein
MQGEVRPVEDHEEWAQLADSETGAYVMQGFVVHDETMNRFVTDQRTVDKACLRLARRKGWDEQLTAVAGPLTTVQPADGETFDRPTPGHVTEFDEEGGWWLLVPVDYLDQVDDPRLEFHVRLGSSELIFWAVEAVALRGGPFPKLPEFGYTVEYAIKDKTLYMYNDHPDAPRQTRDFLNR